LEERLAAAAGFPLEVTTHLEAAEDHAAIHNLHAPPG
jgi:hypothetical protein